MKIKPYVEKLEKSKEFKDFKVKFPDAFMVAGFFVLDLEAGNNVHQIDFYVPSKKKIAAFTLDGEVTLQLLDTINDSIPEKLDLETKIDLDALSGILTDEMRNRNMSEEIRKIVAVIQNIEGKKTWNVNCVLTGMEILKSHVEDESKTVLKIEKSSVMDLIKRIPAQALKGPESKEDIKNEIKRLNEMESQIEKEKQKLTGELNSKGVKKKKL